MTAARWPICGAAGTHRAGGDKAAPAARTLAGKTAQLAAEGDEGAKTVVDQMKRQGICSPPEQQPPTALTDQKRVTA